MFAKSTINIELDATFWLSTCDIRKYKDLKSTRFPGVALDLVKATKIK